LHNIYLYEAREEWICVRGIGQWVIKRSQLSGSKTALICKDRELTYSQLNSRINRLANGLMQLGVQKGTRVAVFLTNGTEILEVMFACAKIGAIFVPVNFRLSVEEVEYILKDSGASVFIYHQEYALLAAEVCKRAAIKHSLSVGDELAEAFAYEDFLAKHGDSEPTSDVDGDEVQMIMYTSGTTGCPKGAMLTHANTFWNIVQILIAQPIVDTDTTFTVAPMFHSGAMTILTLTLLYKGGTVIIANKFDPVQVLQTIEREKITCMFMVPAMWLAVTQVPDFAKYTLRSLRISISAAAPCPTTVIKLLRQKGVALIQAFGLSEVAPVAILNIQDADRKSGSVGKPAFYVDIRIVNEYGQDALSEEIGELLVRAPNLMQGYWEKPQETQAVMQKGWFSTGDCLWKDAEGYLYVAGRKKDVIITGGENVYPVEVEQVLYRHPNIKEAAVVGVSDEKWGEVIKAVIVLKDPKQQINIAGIKAFCEGKLARYKMPKVVEFASVLPRNASGKILKKCLL